MVKYVWWNPKLKDPIFEKKLNIPEKLSFLLVFIKRKIIRIKDFTKELSVHLLKFVTLQQQYNKFLDIS